MRFTREAKKYKYLLNLLSPKCGLAFPSLGTAFTESRKQFPVRIREIEVKNGGSTVVYCLPTTNMCFVACLPKTLTVTFVGLEHCANATKNIPICV